MQYVRTLITCTGWIAIQHMICVPQHCILISGGVTTLMTFHVSTAITLFMTSREQLKVWTFQGGSVNFRLNWCQLTVHDDFLLLRKYLCKFLLLRSAQKKCSNLLLKLKQTFLSFSNRSRHGFDFSHTKYRCHVVILKYLLRVSENMWVDDLKQTPKIQQTILNGRTCVF